MKWETVKTPESSRMAEIAFMEKTTCNVHGEAEGTLQITFRGKNGKPNMVYEYYNVPRVLFAKLALADSKGKVFDAEIKGIFKYKKL